MAKARISCPDKNAMQSGKGKMGQWVLEFERESPNFVDDLMGWVGMRDMKQEIVLRFPTKEAAIAYAQSQRLDFELFEPKRRSLVAKAYADNFKYTKVQSHP